MKPATVEAQMLFLCMMLRKTVSNVRKLLRVGDHKNVVGKWLF